MTKKDGDRLRAMIDELNSMALTYGSGSQTQRGLYSVVDAIDYVVSGRDIRVNPR